MIIYIFVVPGKISAVNFFDFNLRTFEICKVLQCYCKKQPEEMKKKGKVSGKTE